MIIDNQKKLVELIFNSDSIYLQKHSNCYIHKDIFKHLLQFEKCIEQYHFKIKILSCYRSFQDQLNIWNKKVSGKRDVLDINSKKIDITKLSQQELFFSILNWSAFPGLSRHHFGTDMDIADDIYLKKNPNYKVQLIDDEYNLGVFKEFHKIVLANHKHFYFPYQKDLGGIKPEPWHISHLSSKEIIKIYTYKIFTNLLNSDLYKDILLIDIAKKNAHLLYHQYFLPIINK